MPLQNPPSHHHRQGEHDYPDVYRDLDLLIAKNLAGQSEGRAGSAEAEVDAFAGAAGNSRQDQQRRRYQNVNPGYRPSAFRRFGVKAVDGEKSGGDGDEQERHGMHQGDDGALAISKDDVTGHGLN